MAFPVAVRRCCMGLRALNRGDVRPLSTKFSFSFSSSKYHANMLAAGMAPVGCAKLRDELGAGCSFLRVFRLWSSLASRRASSLFKYAVSGSSSGPDELPALSALPRRRRWNCEIHLSRSTSGITRKRTHSLWLSWSGSTSRMRNCEAARWRRAIDKGRFVTASTCRAPKPPLRIAGVLYIAEREFRFLVEGILIGCRKEKEVRQRICELQPVFVDRPWGDR
jgi:hypothetical protein